MNAGRRRRVGTILSLALVIGLGWAPARGDLLPAFPGAEGAGAYATGGRGGDVYHVTNLNDSGLGSLRYGIDNAVGARTIVFDVGGMIELNSTLRIRKSHITIAGQTAPGLGICIKNFDVVFSGVHDIVARHLRVRAGLDRAGTAAGMFDADSLSFNGCQNSIFDHCSASWSIDECMSAANGVTQNITLQWCYVTEGLYDTHDHPYGNTQKHSDGSLIACEDADGSITMHHNLWAHQDLRMPRVRSYNFHYATTEVANNVMYDWGHTAAYGGGSTRPTVDSTYSLYDDRSFWNFRNNYAIAGPSTNSGHLNICLEDWQQGIDPNGVVSTWDMKAYISGNKIDSDRDGVLDGVDTGWGMTTLRVQDRVGTPFVLPGVPVTMDDVDTAYQRVLALAGAMPAFRDSVDARVANEVITQTGSIINSQADVGGYPVLPVEYRASEWDTDQDGMPNWWEIANALNPDVADNNGDLDGDGYTNLEHYLHYMNNAVIPEPSCLSLVLLGALALLVRRHPVETKRRREPG
jgi:pectate lyase